ncbi:hypothetical protein CSW72_13585, partial [Shigella boydii]
DRTNITVGYPQTNRKIDTGKTLTRWPVFVDHFISGLSMSWVIRLLKRQWVNSDILVSVRR